MYGDFSVHRAFWFLALRGFLGVLGPTCCMSLGEGVSCVISLVSLSVSLQGLKV